jgi:hypothetical protein
VTGTAGRAQRTSLRQNGRDGALGRPVAVEMRGAQGCVHFGEPDGVVVGAGCDMPVTDPDGLAAGADGLVSGGGPVLQRDAMPLRYSSGS